MSNPNDVTIVMDALFAITVLKRNDWWQFDITAVMAHVRAARRTVEPYRSIAQLWCRHGGIQW